MGLVDARAGAEATNSAFHVGRSERRLKPFPRGGSRSIGSPPSAEEENRQ